MPIGNPKLRKDRPVPAIRSRKGATRAALQMESMPKLNTRQATIHLRLADLTLALYSFFSSRDSSFLCSAR